MQERGLIGTSSTSWEECPKEGTRKSRRKQPNPKTPHSKPQHTQWVIASQGVEKEGDDQE